MEDLWPKDVRETCAEAVRLYKRYLSEYDNASVPPGLGREAYALMRMAEGGERIKNRALNQSVILPVELL